MQVLGICSINVMIFGRSNIFIITRFLELLLNVISTLNATAHLTTGLPVPTVCQE